jgi:hypothetical protein
MMCPYFRKPLLHEGAMFQTFKDQLKVENPAEVLRGQDGIFEVVSPCGYTFEVTCRPGSPMQVRELRHLGSAYLRPEHPVWEIRRLRPTAA